MRRAGMRNNFPHPGCLCFYLTGVITKRAGRRCRSSYCTCKFLATFATENAAIIMRRASNGSELGNSRLATPLTTAPARGGVRRNGAAEFIFGHRDILLICAKSWIYAKTIWGNPYVVASGTGCSTRIRHLQNAHRCPEAALLRKFDRLRRVKDAVDIIYTIAYFGGKR